MTSRSTIQILTATLMMVAFALAHAGESRIFRTVDEDGNVVFTDIPPREDEPAEQIIIEDPNSFAIDEAVGPRAQWIVEPEGDPVEVPFAYQSLAITAPENDQAIRENAGNVSIVTVPRPGLQGGHRLRLIMDGRLVQEGTQTRFDLENVDRGTHVVVTEILDDAGNVLIRSDDITFHLLRYHIPTPKPTPSG